jgi:ketosteroid isomerase-like protein
VRRRGQNRGLRRDRRLRNSSEDGMSSEQAIFDEITALEHAGREAFLARDIARLDAMWSDALLVNSPINRVHTKQQVLALLVAGTIAHTELDGTVERIERIGELVVVMGDERVVNAPDKPALNRRYTNLWRQEDGRWRLVVRHANITLFNAQAPRAH